MFGWKELGATWPSEQAYQVLELLKHNHIRCRMPADDMFFNSPFHLPRPDLRWAIQVRRQDVRRAMALLAREGLARASEEPPVSAAPNIRPSVPFKTARPVLGCTASAAPAVQLSSIPCERGNL